MHAPGVAAPGWPAAKAAAIHKRPPAVKSQPLRLRSPLATAGCFAAGAAVRFFFLCFRQAAPFRLGPPAGGPESHSSQTVTDTVPVTSKPSLALT